MWLTFSHSSLSTIIKQAGKKTSDLVHVWHIGSQAIVESTLNLIMCLKQPRNIKQVVPTPFYQKLKLELFLQKNHSIIKRRIMHVTHPSAKAPDHWSKNPRIADIRITSVLLKFQSKDSTPGGSK